MAVLHKLKLKVRSEVAKQVRRNGRQISWIPEFMGLGNVLYQWLVGIPRPS